MKRSSVDRTESVSRIKQKPRISRTLLASLGRAADSLARSETTSRKARPSLLTKKVKRYTKLATKAMLLSPVFHRIVSLIVVTFIGTGLLYVSYSYISKSFANEVVISQSEIINRVGLLTALPPEEPYEIVRVQDEETLRKQNSFYSEVKEGDYILVYKHLAVIYDLRNNVIVALKRTK